MIDAVTEIAAIAAVVAHHVAALDSVSRQLTSGVVRIGFVATSDSPFAVGVSRHRAIGIADGTAPEVATARYAYHFFFLTDAASTAAISRACFTYQSPSPVLQLILVGAHRALTRKPPAPKGGWLFRRPTRMRPHLATLRTQVDLKC